MANCLILCNGRQMPILGIGTWQSQPDEVRKAVEVAIDEGYRHIDTAFAYENEAEVGAAIRAKIADGIVKREDLFVVSKLWNTFHCPEDVKPALKKSLSLLGLDYLDMYLIHWPMSIKPGPELFPQDADGNIPFIDVDPVDTWKALELCVDEGLTLAIGLSNFNCSQVQRILDHGRIKPATNQVEIHPLFRNEEIVQYCQSRGVTITAYSPLGSPGRVNILPEQPVLLENPKLKEIAAAHKKTPAQVALRWLIQRDIAVIPKSVTPSRIKENIQLFDFELSGDEMAAIDSLDTGTRMVMMFTTVDGKHVYRDRNAPHFPF